jgi:hypothetical protein
VVPWRHAQGIEIEVAAADRARLEAIVADRNRRQKHVERARIVLLTAEGVGNRYVEENNAEPKPFLWTADPDVVLGEVNRGTQALASVH